MIPVRARLTLIFAAALAVVLAVTGVILFDRLSSSLDGTIDTGLRARASVVAALVAQSDSGLRDARAGNDAGFAQILDRRGRVYDQTAGLPRAPLLTAALLHQAERRQLLVSRTTSTGDRVRLLAVPVVAQGQKLVVVVGSSLAVRDRALTGLRNELLVGGPIALLLGSIVAYFVAAAALRPVERMRRQANTISDRHLAERLPVPRTHDEIERLGTTLNAMLDRIERGVHRERAFLADASHELRTPLALVRAEVEIALDEQREAEELVAALRSIGEEADRLSQLAEDILLVSRLDEGALPLRVEKASVDELFDGIVARFARRAGEGCRTLEAEGGGLVAALDRMRIEQALANLVDNALRHGAGTVRLFALARGSSLELHVSDEGAGLPPGFAPRAFDRFSRADEARSGSGSGLGLAIVKAIAEAHGGSVSASSTKGGGTDVCIRLAGRARSSARHFGSGSSL